MTATLGRLSDSSPPIRPLRAPRTKRVIVPSNKAREAQKNKTSTLSFRDIETVEEDDDETTLRTLVKLVTDLKAIIEQQNTTIKIAQTELSENRTDSLLEFFTGILTCRKT